MNISMYPELALYYESIFQFCQSVVIKNATIGEHIAVLTKNKYALHILENNENPYYLNLAGEYSPYQTPMYIRDPITQSTVYFDKALLQRDALVRSMYTPGSPYFDSLLQQYPEQEHLVRSIVANCCSVEEAISAPDFQLLYCDPSVLHENERAGIITYLQDYISLFKDNWFIKEYTYEDLYALTAWGIFWANLPLMLLAKRMLNIKTAMVHPFHIWEYLGAKGLLDYEVALTTRQELFLYQNIDHFLSNSGKQQSLQRLVDGLLKNTSMGMVANTVGLDTEGSLANINKIAPLLFRTPIETNTFLPAKFHTHAVTVPDFLTALVQDDISDDAILKDMPTQVRRWQHAPVTVLPTKYLELQNVSPLDPHMDLFFQGLFTTFLTNMNKGRLAYFVPFSVEEFDFSGMIDTKTAFVLLCYMVNFLYNTEDPAAMSFPSELPLFPYITPSEVDPTDVYTTPFATQKPLSYAINLPAFMGDFPLQIPQYVTNIDLVKNYIELFKILISDIDTIIKGADVHTAAALHAIYAQLLTIPGE